MQAEDIYKLAFQFSFGPGHFFINEEEALKRLIDEAKSLKENKEEIVEVGNDYYRVHLLNDEAYLRRIYESFINTVKDGLTAKMDFEKLLNDISLYIKDLNISFKEEDFFSLVEFLKEKGYPALSHSEIYRNNYDPHYRLIKRGSKTDVSGLIDDFLTK